MQIDNLLFARDDCVSCGDIPACNCAADQQCIQISRSCDTCTTNQCVSTDSSSGSSSGGVSKGAVAGAVVGSVLFFSLALGFYFWWRKRQQAALNDRPAVQEAKDVPAPASTVLSRPDPTEKHTSQLSPSRQPLEERGTVRVYPTTSNSVIDLDPQSNQAMHINGGAQMHNSHRDSDPNPFGDGHSIQTTSTGSQSTNVIPIALVPPGSVGSRFSTPSQSGSSSSVSSRPDRSPDGNINLEHLNVSQDTVPSAVQDLSARPGFARNSYLTTASGASYASDILNEAPVIVTQSQRQVLGTVKAEVVHAPSSSGANSLRTISMTSRPPVRSPLAASAFGPSDVLSERSDAESQHTQEVAVTNDPFDDENSLPPPTTTGGNRTSAATFGSDTSSLWTPLPAFASRSAGSSRPISLDTQAGSIIGADIRDATRVHLGFVQPNSAPFIPATPVSSSAAFTPSQQRSAYRITSGRLVTPTSADTESLGGMKGQQARALAQAKAVKAQAMEDRESSRMSMSTVASNGADSILESFPFVPPSPISNRPLRTPPRSPLAQSSQAQAGSAFATSNQQTLTQFVEQEASEENTFVPPNRKVLGMSTASEMSNMSTGLGSFPFQIETSDDRPSDQVVDAGSMEEEQSGAPGAKAVAGRQRASLDTLALTSDLSSYPLGSDSK